MLQTASQTEVPAEQLRELLIAWRKLRHPRIAELIDRVSARVLEGQKPIKGKSVPDRVKAVAAACATKDPVEVGRALATEWPGTWQTALPMLEAILSLPDDPRVARELARQVDLTRYDTWTSSAFFRPLFARLNALGDVRQLAILEAQLPRAKSYYYVRDMRPLEEHAVAVHRALVTPALSKEDAALLDVLEVPYAGAVSREKTRHRSGADLLEAVYANPEDVGARAVYGDWLTEQGDPRGELISLQLAPQTEKSGRRQQALIKKHWKTWLGPLVDWFDQPPHFEAGFPVDGRVAYASGASPGAFLKMLAHREWCTFHSLTRYWSAPDELIAAVKHPNLKALRTLREIHPEALAALAATGAPLTTLAIHSNVDNFHFEPGLLKKLTKLEVVSVNPRLMLQLGPALGPLKRLVFSTIPSELAPDLWQRLEALDVEAVELRYYAGGCVTVTRARPGGPFTAARFGSSHYVNELIPMLPGTLTEVASDGVPRVKVPKQALAQLEPLFARFPSLKRKELPFEAEPDRAQVPHVDVSMSGVAFFEEKMLAPLMKILSEDFSVKFDSFDARGDLDLGDDPVAKLTTWVKNKRCRGVRIKVRGTRTEFALHREPTYYTSAALPLGDPKRFLAALEALMTFAKPGYLRVARGKEIVTIEQVSEVAAHREQLRALLKAQ